MKILNKNNKWGFVLILAKHYEGLLSHARHV